MINITLVAGARPNFMKIAPIISAIKKSQAKGIEIQFRLVHTGQHYDKKMSGDFFEQLNIPEPDTNLEAGGGTQAEQTAAIMVAFEKELMQNKPSFVLLVGDVTSTLACSIVAKKLNIDVIHVEGGIRSGDMSMPEEINRIVTDSITDHFFTTSEIANINLRNIGVEEGRIHFVGNTMIDTLYLNKKRFFKPGGPQFEDLEKGNFIMLTLHRPSNVDNETQLKAIIEIILENTANFPIIFPVHPRTSLNLKKIGINYERLRMVEPLTYLEFNYLVQQSKGVITDSGGVTEEASVMNIPCLTLRDTTERPETIELGTNELVGTNSEKFKPYLIKLLSGNWKSYKGIPMWDGKSAGRIVDILIQLYS